MKYKVLHLLSQRPSLTGSGITLDSLVRYGQENGWQQCVVVGIPKGESEISVGNLAAGEIKPLFFETPELSFPVPGMSDVMPYASTVFSQMSDAQIKTYLSAWQKHIAQIISDFKPDIIHSHHIWLMSSLLKDIAPNIPVLNQCHATGIRQMELNPHLKDRVIFGCARNEGFQVLREDHAAQLVHLLNLSYEQVHIIPPGYHENIFHSKNIKSKEKRKLLYAGKFSIAKGLPCLLDTFELLLKRQPELELHVAGSGTGEEAEGIRQRMIAMSPSVILHGQVDQNRLADLMRQCSVFILPSFYEGIPLVLVEALACGCRVVTTMLPGVATELAPFFPGFMELVPLPKMITIDTPEQSGTKKFVNDLFEAICKTLGKNERALDQLKLEKSLTEFTWESVFGKVEKTWLKLIERKKK